MYAVLVFLPPPLPLRPVLVVYRKEEWPAQDTVVDPCMVVAFIGSSEFINIETFLALFPDQMAAWREELEGVNIPDIPQTDGTCAGSPSNFANAAANAWWSCGGHTRDTDVTACPTKYTWGVSFDDGPGPYTGCVPYGQQAESQKANFGHSVENCLHTSTRKISRLPSLSSALA